MSPLQRTLAVPVLATFVLCGAAVTVRSMAAPPPRTAHDETPRAKFEVYKDKAGEFRWRLRATNTQVLAISSDGYKAKRDCLSAIESVKRDVANAPVNDLTEGQSAAKGEDHGNADEGKPTSGQTSPSNARRQPK